MATQHTKVDDFRYSPFLDWLENLRINFRKGGLIVVAEPTTPPTIHIWREKR